MADLVRIIRLTGSRPSEIRGLRLFDIVRNAEVWQADLRHRNKNSHRGQCRTLMFGPKAQEILLPYLVDREESEFVFSPARSREQQYQAMREARKSPVQPSQKNRKSKKPIKPFGEFYDANSLRRCITRACERAFEMPDELRTISRDLSLVDRRRLQALARAWRKANVWRPGQLRHTAATSLRSRFGLEAVKACLGHRLVETSQIYAERDLETQRNVMRVVG